LDFIYKFNIIIREIILIELLNKKCNTNIKADFTDLAYIFFIEFLKSNYKNAKIFIYSNEAIINYILLIIF
jgi:hypothetical protein